jgi:N-formylglutamate amidohydrolase
MTSGHGDDRSQIDRQVAPTGEHDVAPTSTGWVCEERYSPVVMHVPHAGTYIPEDVRQQLLLDDSDLETELRHMTDWHTDVLARLATSVAAHPPTCFVNRLSRLVVDPERFDDEREEMREVGMGPVYVSTSHRQPLRSHDPQRDNQLMATFFSPYKFALADVVDRTLARHGRCVIIDLHSYPTQALPYELHQTAPRPMVCIGTDPAHTPAHLQAAAVGAFSDIADDLMLNTPFGGTYVPDKHHGHDHRVTSVMVELRRDLYLDPHGLLHDHQTARLATALAHLIDRAHIAP